MSDPDETIVDMRSGRVTTEQFVVKYDGPALDGHEMDVADLAPALLALSQAYQRAQRLVAPGTEPANLRIKAFESGSFEIAMVLHEAQSALRGAIDLFSSQPITAVANLGAITSFVWASLNNLKVLGARAIRGLRNKENGRVELVLDDHTVLEVDDAESRLLLDLDYRKSIETFVMPLDRDGVQNVTVFDRRRVTLVHVEQEDLPAFRTPAVGEEDISVDHRVTTLQLLGVEFDRRKWRFTEGSAPLSATIEDDAFRARIEGQEAVFGKNDLLRVRLRTRQYRDKDGRLKADHAIEHVIDHIDGGRQLPFDL